SGRVPTDVARWPAAAGQGRAPRRFTEPQVLQRRLTTGQFANLLPAISFGLGMLTYYSAPIPGMGYSFRDEVPNQMLLTNPLGLVITYCREDQAFGN
ncbi:MAG: hypothetical protein ACYDC6_14745, partial [Acidobacteriaceae bacterium]